jgi:Domain of unknown function (DUF1707)
MASAPSAHTGRTSDAGRDRAVHELRGHFLAGRFTIEEFEERLAAALVARTEADLSELFFDVPSGLPGSALLRAAAWVRACIPALLGAQPFLQSHEFEMRREQLFATAHCHLVPGLIAGGYDLGASIEPSLLVFEASERPAWVPAACVLAFPIGLLSLMVRNNQRVVLAFQETAAGGSRMIIQGVARQPVQRALSTLSDAP